MCSGWFWLRVSHELVSRMLLASTAIIWSCDEAGGSSSKLPKIYTGSLWQEASVPHLELLSRQVLVPDMAAGIPQSKWSKKDQDRSHTVFFMTPPWKSHTTPLLYSFGHSDQPWYNVRVDSIMTRILEGGGYWIHFENWLPHIIREISILTCIL